MDGPVSRIEWVEDQLRRAILSGELGPGERLLTAPLSERFQVSPTPLREALHRFAGEGLVEFIPQRGARVTDLSVSDCAELSELRVLLDQRCVQRSIANADQEWRDEVTAYASTLRELWQAQPHDAGASETAYRAFYEVLARRCDSGRLHRQAAVIRDLESRYRLVSIDTVDRVKLAEIHERLVDAALSGDETSAADAVRDEVTLFADAYYAQVGEEVQT